jgi:hypothetical protein
LKLWVRRKARQPEDRVFRFPVQLVRQVNSWMPAVVDELGFGRKRLQSKKHFTRLPLILGQLV